MKDWNTKGYLQRATADDVKRDLQAGADVNARDGIDWTPLHKAARHGVSAEVIKALRDAGADENARTKGGWAPLPLAIFNPNKQPMYELHRYELPMYELQGTEGEKPMKDVLDELEREKCVLADDFERADAAHCRTFVSRWHYRAMTIARVDTPFEHIKSVVYLVAELPGLSFGTAKKAKEAVDDFWRYWGSKPEQEGAEHDTEAM